MMMISNAIVNTKKRMRLPIPHVHSDTFPINHHVRSFMPQWSGFDSWMSVHRIYFLSLISNAIVNTKKRMRLPVPHVHSDTFPINQTVHAPQSWNNVSLTDVLRRHDGFCLVVLAELARKI